MDFLQETLQQRIMRHEGFVAFPKIDVAPMYVIGYGHDITETEAKGMYANGISQSDAQTLLASDIAKCKQEVKNDLPWSQGLSGLKQEILEEMAFQIGIEGLLEFKNMLACAQKGDDAGVAENMLASDWHDETPERCEELADLWLGKDVASASAK
jgi:lysozyme